MKLLLLHGWGFDASLWDAMRALLPEFETVVWDRGYFGPPARDVPEGPFLAVGHSLGSMLLAFDPLPGCVGLLAVNGFDRFVGPDRVPARVVARMRERFAARPAEVLRDFRARCGADEGPQVLDYERLSPDLEILAEGDARAALSARDGLGVGARKRISTAAGNGWRQPTHREVESRPRAILKHAGHVLPRDPSLAGRGITVLHGAEDPILPPAMRNAVFPGAHRTTCPGAGHLLPLTHPHWCADQLREVMACA